jgi:hypothetical protein
MCVLLEVTICLQHMSLRHVAFHCHLISGGCVGDVYIIQQHATLYTVCHVIDRFHRNVHSYTSKL